MNSLQVTDDESKAVQKTPNRVSLESITERIATVEYLRPTLLQHVTLAVITLENGYVVTGESAPADPDNFNEDLGKKFAYENAIRKIWPLEGYLLAEKLWRRKGIKARAEDDGVYYDEP